MSNLKREKQYINDKKIKRSFFEDHVVDFKIFLDTIEKNLFVVQWNQCQKKKIIRIQQKLIILKMKILIQQCQMKQKRCEKIKFHTA